MILDFLVHVFKKYWRRFVVLFLTLGLLLIGGRKLYDRYFHRAAQEEAQELSCPDAVMCPTCVKDCTWEEAQDNPRREAAADQVFKEETEKLMAGAWKEMIEKRTALREAVRDIPPPPTALPILPDAEFTVGGVPVKFGGPNIKGGVCVKDYTTFLESMRVPIDIDWRLVVAGDQRWFAENAKDDAEFVNGDSKPAAEDVASSRYRLLVDMLTNTIEWTLSLYKEDSIHFSDSSAIRKLMVEVAEDELKLKAFAEWAMGSYVRFIGDLTELPAEFLRRLWKASHADMSALRVAVEKHENEEYGNSYWYENGLKPEGWFFRRCADAKEDAQTTEGEQDACNDRLLMYDFWLFEAARALRMPEAAGWGQELLPRLAAAKTLKLAPYYRHWITHPRRW